MARIDRWIAALLLTGLLSVAGCGDKDKPADKLPHQEKPKQNGGDLPVTPPRPVGDQAVGVDDRDDPAPQVAGIFPKSGSEKAGRWVKRTPVKLYQVSTLDRMVDRVSFYLPYGIDWAADCQYLLANDPTQAVVVQLFHCRDSGDAYGLMSVHSEQSANGEIGQEVRGAGTPKPTLNIWKSNYFLRLYTPLEQNAAFETAMRQLAVAITANLSGEGSKPQLVQIMEGQGLLAGQLHYFRGPDSIASRWINSPPYDAELSHNLKLNSDEQAVLAAYRTPGTDNAPCFMFIAKYSSPSRASEAHRRLVALAKLANTSMGQNLVLGPLRGQYVFGTTTMMEYSRRERAAAAGPPNDQFTLYSIDQRIVR